MSPKSLANNMQITGKAGEEFIKTVESLERLISTPNSVVNSLRAGDFATAYDRLAKLVADANNALGRIHREQVNGLSRDKQQSPEPIEGARRRKRKRTT
jgi:hypothetical protein